MRRLKKLIKYLDRYKDLFLFKRNDKFYFIYSGVKYVAPSKRQARIYLEHLRTRFKKLRFPFNTEKSILLDIGGNIGYTTHAYCSRLNGTGSTVYMFEPSLINIQCSQQNLKMLRGGYKIVPFALSNSNKTKDKIITMAIPQWVYNLKKEVKNTGYLSAKGLNLSNNGFSEEVLSIKLDDLKLYKVAHPPVNFIKVDVEGFELNVIQGGIKTISQHLPLIQIEYNPFTLSFNELDEIIRIISKLKYEVYSELPLIPEKQNEIYFVHPIKHKQVLETQLNDLIKN